MFTAGSIGDLVLTVAFIPILCNFPRFIRKVKAEGVDSSVIIRLRKFFELNVSFVLLSFFISLYSPLLAITSLLPFDIITPWYRLTHIDLTRPFCV